MNPTIIPEIKEVLEEIYYRPAVSIIMPFEPKMNSKAELAQALKTATDKVARELLQNYPGEVSSLVLQKLRKIIKTLNYNTYKKSVAIYVSPVFEKVLYLDITLEQKVVVDETFKIRDLLYHKKRLRKYIVLLLSSRASQVYLGDSATLVRIISNTPESVGAYINELSESVANISGKPDRKETVMNKFLRHIDNSLDIILSAYPFPLFILGTEKIAGHFKSITKHPKAVIEYVHGNYGDATVEELKDILKPHVDDWKRVKQKDLLNQLEEAAGKKKLAVGMRDVWREAAGHTGRLLLVEKNYMFAAQHGSRKEVIKTAEPYNKFSYIKDTVDEVIEKVLESGGDIEFVDDDVLADNHIALIKYC